MTGKLQINSFAWSAALCAVFLLLPVQNVSAQLFHVDSVRFSSAPSFSGDSTFYTLDCYFRERPENFGSYYDKHLNAIVIEFFDDLLMVPEVKFPRESPFKDFKVKAVETKMALSGVMTRMVISLEKGPADKRLWNYNAKLNNRKILCVSIWKKMTSLQEKMAEEKRARSITFLVGLSLSLVIAVTGIFVFLNLETSPKP